MVVSQARVDANRRNALKSCGPVTPEGKERSRANALKHGLCSMTVVPESEEQSAAVTAAFKAQFQPEGEYPLWLVGQAALASLRIDRCQMMERALRDKAAMQAELGWGDDLRLEVVRLGQSISRTPEVVVEQLRQTLPGCDWLMARWAMLAHAADCQKGWSPDQVRLAFDLLATPLEFREGARPGALIDPMGRPIESAKDPASLARRMIAELRERREALGELDEVNRSLAMADLDDGTDPERKRLRRHEATLQRRLRWCLDQLKKRSTGEPSPEPRDASTVRISPEGPPSLAVEPQPIPPAPPMSSPDAATRVTNGRISSIDMAIGFQPIPTATLLQSLPLPEPSMSRADRKILKAEARREARLRKLDKIRS